MVVRWVPLYSGCVTKLCNAVMSNRVTEFFKIGGIDYCISLISLSKKKKKNLLSQMIYSKETYMSCQNDCTTI